MHYHDSDDLKRIADFKQLAPAEFSAFVEFDKTVGTDEGAISRKYRELIAIRGGVHDPVPILPRCAHSRGQKRGRQP